MRVGRFAACLICESQGRQPTFLCLIPALLPDILSKFGNKGYRHGTSMKSLFSLIFLFLFANSAFAANLCDTSCNLTITFPTGGSIEATETLTFTFGTGGVLDLGTTGTINTAVQPSSTDFSTGGTLALAAGESITFDAGGSLDLGTGGAFDFTSIAVTTDGVFDLQIDSVAETVYVGGITINGTGTLKITVTGSNLELGSIAVDGGDVVITSTGIISQSGGSFTTDPCSTSSISSSFTISSGNIGTIDPTISTTCLANIPTIDPAFFPDPYVDGDEVTFPDGSSCIVNNGQCITDTGVIYTVYGSFMVITSYTLSFNPVYLSPLYMAILETTPPADGELVSFIDGSACFILDGQCIDSESGVAYEIFFDLYVGKPINLADTWVQGNTYWTSDGGHCTVTNGMCIDDAGVEYRMNNEGELVKIEPGSGSVSITVLLFAFFSLLYTRRFISGRI